MTNYQYDEIGNLTSFIDAENHATSYTYGSAFGLTRTQYPDSEYEEYSYDDVGNLSSFVDCSGNETTYTYDSAYRLIEIQYEDSSTVSLTYDLNGNRTQMDDDAPGTGDYEEYHYDYWNRLTSKTRHISQSSYTISYQYDVANRMTVLTYPDDMQIIYSFNDLNGVTEVKRYVDGSNDEILLDNAQYDTENLLTQFDYGNGLQATFSYDSRDRISTLDVKNGETSFLDLDYTYDNSSNITQIVNGWRDTDSDWNSDTETYSYDGLNRLTSASCNSWSHSYTYDRVGNITSKDSITYTNNSVNEVTALGNGTSFTYDDNGNRTQKTKGTDDWDYTYDCKNRLTKLEKNSTTIGEYVYDGDGRRLQATENGVTTTYICSKWSVLYEETSSGSAAYVYGPTGLLAKRTTVSGESNTYYYHTDHLSSTRLVTDDNSDIVSAVTYHPFGEIDIQEGSEDFLYAGKELDSTGLYCFGARYYDPDLGRFITRDSWTYLPNDFRSLGRTIAGWMSNPELFNRYSYCGNNPLRFTDSNGHGWLEALFWGAVLVGTVVTTIAIAIVCPVALPLWVNCVTGLLAVVAFYQFIWAVFEATHLRVKKSYSTEDHVTRVDWMDMDGNQLGGWYEVYDPEGGGLLGYKVYSKETGTWEFVSADDWTPPPPPKQGEPTEPITYEDVIEEINKKKDPDPESGSGDGNNGGSGSQGGGSGQGEHAPREPNQYY